MLKAAAAARGAFEFDRLEDAALYDQVKGRDDFTDTGKAPRRCAAVSTSSTSSRATRRGPRSRSWSTATRATTSQPGQHRHVRPIGRDPGGSRVAVPRRPRPAQPAGRRQRAQPRDGVRHRDWHLQSAARVATAGGLWPGQWDSSGVINVFDPRTGLVADRRAGAQHPVRSPADARARQQHGRGRSAAGRLHPQTIGVAHDESRVSSERTRRGGGYQPPPRRSTALLARSRRARARPGKAKWSQRNNNNYQQTALLTSLHYFSNNSKLFLKNFYLKSKRSIDKPKNEGPAAYVFPGGETRVGNQAELLRTLQLQGVEISRATAPFTVPVKAKRTGGPAAATPSPSPAASPARRTDMEDRTFPAGSYIVRMDQPYSRIADALLDYQYWAPNDPQTAIYDDTAWTMGELANVEVVRVVDAKVLQAPMDRITGDVRSTGGIANPGSVYLINHNADNALVTLRYRLKDVEMEAAEEPFEAGGSKFNRGSFIIRRAPEADLRRVASELGIRVHAVAAAPTVKTHALRAPRIAIMHTWMTTQDEGWWRLGFDHLQDP